MHSAMKFLNKSLMVVFSIQYCISSPTPTQFSHGVFKVFAVRAVRWGGPFLLGHPVNVPLLANENCLMHEMRTTSYN